MLALNGLKILLQHENRGKCIRGGSSVQRNAFLVKVQVSMAAPAD